MMMRFLRQEHREQLGYLGVHGHRELRQAFETSTFKRSWFADGDLCGLGGVTGTALSSSGLIWLALAQGATRYPVEIIKEAKRQIAGVLETKRELVTTVIAGDQTAMRFAGFIGFHVMGDPIAVGKGRMVPMRYQP